MGKGILISGLILGILGLLWSFYISMVVLVLSVLGGEPGAVLVTIFGIPVGIAAIVGAVIGLKRTRIGAGILLGAAVFNIVVSVSAFLSQGLELSLMDLLGFFLLIHWWSIGLIIAGSLGLAFGVRREAPSARGEA